MNTNNTGGLYIKAQEVVERNTGRPAYLCNDEEWYTAVEEARAELGIKEKAPVCAYCGSVAPYGDERHMWISVHQSWFHKRWWGWKNRKKGRGE